MPNITTNHVLLPIQILQVFLSDISNNKNIIQVEYRFCASNNKTLKIKRELHENFVQNKGSLGTK